MAFEIEVVRPRPIAFLAEAVIQTVDRALLCCTCSRMRPRYSAAPLPISRAAYQIALLEL